MHSGDVTAFFESYAAAFVAESVESIAGLYRFPMQFYIEDGSPVSFDAESFNTNSEKLLGVYKKLGVAAVAFDLTEELDLGPALKLATPRWHFLNAQGENIYSASARYLLQADGDTFFIRAVFVLDEPGKIKGLLEAAGPES